MERCLQGRRTPLGYAPLVGRADKAASWCTHRSLSSSCIRSPGPSPKIEKAFIKHRHNNNREITHIVEKKKSEILIINSNMYSSVVWTLQQSLFYKNLIDMFLPALGAKLLAPSGKHTRGSVGGRIHAVAPSIEQPRSQPRSLLPPPPVVSGRYSHHTWLAHEFQLQFFTAGRKILGLGYACK